MQKEQLYKFLVGAKALAIKAGHHTWVGLKAAGKFLGAMLAGLGRTLKRFGKAAGLLIGKVSIAVFKFFGLIVEDLLAAAGIGFLSYGVYMIYPPAGFITLGVLLIASAYVVARFKGRR